MRRTLSFCGSTDASRSTVSPTPSTYRDVYRSSCHIVARRGKAGQKTRGDCRRGPYRLRQAVIAPAQREGTPYAMALPISIPQSVWKSGRKQSNKPVTRRFHGRNPPSALWRC